MSSPESCCSASLDLCLELLRKKVLWNSSSSGSWLGPGSDVGLALCEAQGLFGISSIILSLKGGRIHKLSTQPPRCREGMRERGENWGSERGKTLLEVTQHFPLMLSQGLVMENGL